MRLVTMIALAALTAPLPAAAQMAACTASVEGETVDISYQTDLVPERGTIDRLLGRGAEDGEGCPPEAVLAYLTPMLTPEERAPFCLLQDEAGETVTGFSEGSRDSRLVCENSTSLCERVNQSTDAAMTLAGIDPEAGMLENAGNVGGRIDAVRDASGATIVKGTTGLVSGALGSLGATALSALTAPAAIAAATVTVVAAGGAVYVCR